jgi:hypothetical protein
MVEKPLSPLRHCERRTCVDTGTMVASRSNHSILTVTLRVVALAASVLAILPMSAQAQDRQPWQNPQPREVYRNEDAYRPPAPQGGEVYVPPPPGGQGYGGQAYQGEPQYRPEPDYRNSPDYRPAPSSSYDRGYEPPPGRGPYGGPPPGPYNDREPGTFSQNEILHAGHGFFGSVSKGLASVVEYTFQKAGRPNGYILGEDAGGAFIAGLRYGEGTLYTKDAGVHKVYWQGPSVGYDFGGEGSKTMVLVYNMRSPHDIFDRFGGVQGSAYFIGGVGVQFLKSGDVTLAPIRSGIGFRLGANIGYLKYTPRPTWNPF